MHCFVLESSDLNQIRDIIGKARENEICFVCPKAIFIPSGADYLLKRSENLAKEFPHKKLIFRYEVGEAPGYALGALRMGIRRLLFKGPKETLEKLQSIARLYQAH